VHPVVWFEIGVPSTSRAREFYGALFGWTFRALAEYSPDYWVIEMGPDAPVGGALAAGSGRPSAGDTGPLVYVAVDDLGAALARAADLGGSAQRQPTPVGDGTWFAEARDPFGNRLGLWSATEPPT
jgi:predicted enzyme related to lactoylglutathione lyase